jgi:hypothetical protein
LLIAALVRETAWDWLDSAWERASSVDGLGTLSALTSPPR